MQLNNNIEEKIKSYACEIGIDLVRITGAESLYIEDSKIDELQRRRFLPESSYLSEIYGFENHKSQIVGAKSVIVAALSYNIPVKNSSFEDNSDEPFGIIASYTRANYYKELKKKLEKLTRFLKVETGQKGQFKIFVNGKIAEKPLAARAGIGFYGKNGLIVNKEFGSWIVLGGIILNTELTPDGPIANGCGDCRLCIDTCPTGAIVQPYILNINRCISHISQYSVDMDDDVTQLWQNRLFGCDTCQDVCPYNKTARVVDRSVKYGYVGRDYPLTKIIDMEEDKYRRIFNGNQMGASWVSFDAIKRNAIVAIGNSNWQGRNNLLERLKKDSNLFIKMHTDRVVKSMKYHP